MGKASSAKKARAAGASKRPPARQRSLLYPAVIAVAVLAGTALVVLSRGGAQNRGEGERPRLIASNPEDHWHMAYGINVCGEYQPDLPQAVNSGIHTHADGLIH